MITDHKALAELKSIKIPEGRLGRFILKLQNLDHEIIYRPGKLNGNADALSRLKCNSIQITSEINWPDEQSRDINLLELRQALLTTSEEPTNNLKQTNKYLIHHGKFTIDSDNGQSQVEYQTYQISKL